MLSLATALNRLPVTRAHIRVTVIIGLGLFFDFFDVFLAGVIGTVLTTFFQMSQTLLPAVLGSSFLGMFFGATCMGTIADRAGRRPAFLINLGIYSLFTLLGAFSVNPEMLAITRFLAGVGIGAEVPLSDTYLSEILPARHRGRLIAWAYTIGFLGVPVVGLLARILVPLSPLGVAGWRWLFVAGSLGGAIVWALRRGLPESPRWLEFAGQSKGAHSTTRLPVRTLFTGQYRSRTFMLWVFHVFQTVGYYGFGTIVPLVLASKGFSVVTSLTYTTVAFIGYPLGSLLSLLFVERMERRRLIVCSALLMAVFGLLLGYTTTPVAIMAFGVLYTITSNIFSNAYHILQGEIFPTSNRATATGSAYGLSRLSSAAMPFVLLPVLRHFGATVMFATIAGAMIIVMADIGLFAPRTTGRTLEEINP
ncbi:MAG TPA: MFS transporter [Bryobacteraceae bacterium]|jgi:putative MFS transporter|nr:MFS transporter [Bryobacteraceae bacterium]